MFKKPGISHIEIYLEKFRSVVPPGLLLKRVFIEAVKEELGVSLSVDQVSVFRYTVKISSVPPPLRIELLLRKNKIEERCRDKSLVISGFTAQG